MACAAACAPTAWAGPYAPAAGELGSTAIDMNDPAIVAWANGYADYLPAPGVDPTWQTPELALGPAQSNSFDIVTLGAGGRITLTFSTPIGDGPGPDFAVFENAFGDNFLELAFVEVSSDGVHFERFDSDSLTPNPVGPFEVAGVDPTHVTGLAGKYRQGFGTPFDLADLAGVDSLLDVASIGYVRLIDVVGDGSVFDTSGDPIYDPYPTFGSPGFDLDAVAVLNQAGSALPADGNGDGVVDLLDFDILASGFGAGPGVVGGASVGDFNQDGGVDLLDFDVLAQSFGAGPGVAIPEPASVGALAALISLRGRRRSGAGRYSVEGQSHEV
ncbi:MAG: dockerin type I domain-containing protein [Planctomycetota bacterium]